MPRSTQTRKPQPRLIRRAFKIFVDQLSPHHTPATLGPPLTLDLRRDSRRSADFDHASALVLRFATTMSLRGEIQSHVALHFCNFSPCAPVRYECHHNPPRWSLGTTRTTQSSSEKSDLIQDQEATRKRLDGACSSMPNLHGKLSTCCATRAPCLRFNECS